MKPMRTLAAAEFSRQAAGPFSFLEVALRYGVPPLRSTAFWRVGGFTGLHHLCIVLADGYEGVTI